ncbi:MAG: hypothetical protein ABIQ31_17675 [Ferruginibacter sp.]
MNSLLLPPQPVRQLADNRNAAVFASLKKQAAHFFNSDFIGTEPTKGS